MRRKSLLPAVAGAALALSVLGCATEVVVRSPPPAERVEVAATPPSPEHFWIKGNWRWDGREFLWVPGRWEIRRAAALWQAGHWRESGGGWVWVEGRWVSR